MKNKYNNKTEDMDYKTNNNKLILIIVCILVAVVVVFLIMGIAFYGSLNSRTTIPIQSNNIIDNSEAKSIQTGESTDDVTIEIVEETLTSDSADIIITNNNTKNCTFGTDFKLQKKNGADWVDLEYLPNTSFTGIAFLLNENSSTKHSIDIKHYYGLLDKGTYRLSKLMYLNVEEREIYSNEFEIK